MHAKKENLIQGRKATQWGKDTEGEQAEKLGELMNSNTDSN